MNSMSRAFFLGAGFTSVTVYQPRHPDDRAAAVAMLLETAGGQIVTIEMLEKPAFYS